MCNRIYIYTNLRGNNPVTACYHQVRKNAHLLQLHGALSPGSVKSHTATSLVTSFFGTMPFDRLHLCQGTKREALCCFMEHYINISLKQHLHERCLQTNSKLNISPRLSSFLDTLTGICHCLLQICLVYRPSISKNSCNLVMSCTMLKT